jgi:hypothetical protein
MASNVRTLHVLNFVQLTRCQQKLSQTPPPKICYTNIAHVHSCTLIWTSYILIAYRVPIYSISSWVSIMSLDVAMWVDPIRDIYEVRLGPKFINVESEFSRPSRSIRSFNS